jgi:hypothetical protein
MASLLYFLFRRIYLFLAFSIKEAFAEWELEFSHMMLVFPENVEATGRAGSDHNTGAPMPVGPSPLARLAYCLKNRIFRLNRAAIVFSIARNHLIGMTYGKMSPPSAARLPKTNHTGLLSEAKADCLGKSTSSSASG